MIFYKNFTAFAWCIGLKMLIKAVLYHHVYKAHNSEVQQLRPSGVAWYVGDGFNPALVISPRDFQAN